MRVRFAVMAAAAAAVLSGCLGDGSPSVSQGDGSPSVSAVKVAGDSLADGGTYGYKFTVQGANLAQTRIWVDWVAEAANVRPLCPRYVATSETNVIANPQAANCTNHAVGDARINVIGTSGQDDTPFSVVKQLRDLGERGYGSRDLLLVNGGINDIVDLLGAYLEAYLTAGNGSGTAYTALLAELLSPAQLQAAAAAGQAGLAQAGDLYMLALADRLADALRDHALAKGAQRIALVNAPDITLTPGFKEFEEFAQAILGRGVGHALAAQVAHVARSWIQAFNGRLAQRFTGENRVVVIDLYGEFGKWLATPAAYGLTNVTTPACPAITDDMGLPEYNIKTCTAAALDATPGKTAGWWQTYLFSDDDHFTPRANQLFGEWVTRTLKAKGWL